MTDKLAIDGGPKAVTNKLAIWPQFDEKAIRAVEAGRDPVNGGEQAPHNLKIILAGYESARTGRAVEV
jgi:predicted dehydrogenase